MAGMELGASDGDQIIMVSALEGDAGELWIGIVIREEVR